MLLVYIIFRASIIIVQKQRVEEKVMTEDEMAGWHHRLDGRESE